MTAPDARWASASEEGGARGAESGAVVGDAAGALFQSPQLSCSQGTGSR